MFEAYPFVQKINIKKVVKFLCAMIVNISCTLLYISEKILMSYLAHLFLFIINKITMV